MFHVKHAPDPLSPRALADQLGIPDDALNRLEIYVSLLRKWQRGINLVSNASLADVWRRHVLDSAQLHSLIPPDARVILDMGSGAGFPGLVLAILGGFEIHLVESDARKCAFLHEVNRATNAGAIVHNGRIEALTPFPVDIITARALAPLDVLLSYAQLFLNKNTFCLFQKGKKANEELTKAQENWKIDITRIQSASDPSGIILLLGDISRRHGLQKTQPAAPENADRRHCKPKRRRR
jgi:16S rRNA (guanine527-N7)-methyltransferase